MHKTSDMEIADPAALYADARSKAIDIFRSLSEAEADAPVPLNPAWRLVDVAAHVCGIVDDVLHGNVDGLGTDAWTAAQVDKRVGLSVATICDEWEGYSERVDEMVAGNPFFGVRITGDLIIHIHDVQHALGLKVDQGDMATRAAADRYAPSLQERAMEQMQLGIALTLTDGDRYAEPEGATSTIGLRCSSYDFLRSVTGRRSRRQVAALDWDGDPTALLDGAWNTYGPMPDDDVSI